MTNKLNKLLLSILAAFFVGNGYAHDVEIDGIFYNLNKDSKTASVTYKGSSYSSDIDRYIGNVVIPSAITHDGNTYSVMSIGDRAFDSCSGLTSVTIPSSVTSIGTGAFSYCSGMTSVDIPSSVTSIGWNAFFGCRGLTSVTIPSSVTSIRNNVFIMCSGLTAINVSSDNSEYSSADGILYNKDKTCLYVCPGGKVGVVSIPSSVTSIGNNAFDGCSSLTSVDIPSSVTSIGNNAFDGCSSLTSVDIPSSVTSIGSEAFSRCSGLTSVDIPSSVTSIGWGAFYDCRALTSVDIPSSVTSIGTGAFSRCSGLTAINVSSDNSVFSSADGILYDKDKTCLYACPGGKVGVVSIPSSVTSIGYSAFEGCRGLTSVDIPSSVTSIGNNAFEGCRGLTSITIPPDVRKIEDRTFEDCNSLTSVTIPSSVTSIGWFAFKGCSALTSVTIPPSVTSIGWSTFDGCSSLTSVDIPSSVTSIGKYAFNGCTSLESIYSFSPVPPKCDGYAFSVDNYQNAMLYVPFEAVETYKSTEPWSNFLNIQGFDPTGIDGISDQSLPVAAARYDAAGRKIAAPVKGLNVIRYSNGKTQKIVVK